MYTVTRETFDSLASFWADSANDLQWNSVFLLPAWLKVWWQEFGAGNEAYLAVVRDDSRIIGIAPLKIKGEEASIVGSENVCDYVDFVVAAGREDDFFNVLLDDLKQKGVKHLELGLVRADSLALTRLTGIARNRGCEAFSPQQDVSLT